MAWYHYVQLGALIVLLGMAVYTGVKYNVKM